MSEYSTDPGLYILSMTKIFLQKTLTEGNKPKSSITWNQDNLKVSKVKDLINHLSDLAKILHISLKHRRHQIKDDFEVLKVEYPSNNLLDLAQI